MKNKNKLYLVVYTSRDRWEMSKGVMVVSASTKAEATKMTELKIGGNDILTLTLIKPSGTKILFNQDPVI